MDHFDIPHPLHQGEDQLARQPLELIATAVLLFVLLSALGFWNFFAPPAAFPSDEVVSIETDASVTDIAQELKRAEVIRSPFIFEALTRVTGSDRTLSSGLYVFDRPLTVVGIINRIARGEHGITPMRVTLPEGMSVREMAQRLEEQIQGFNGAAFIEQASSSEGYLFPDTYDFMPTATPETVITRLRARFDEVVQKEPMLASSTRPLDELVIMASLLEREAQTDEDKRIIAGILWSRLANHMPLQVDAVFGYLYGKSGYAPTFTDLEIDSPYNTYVYRGLPPGPIANPGLESLIAAATPIDTEYVFYLTGNDGRMYYAETFTKHQENRRLYLSDR